MSKITEPHFPGDAYDTTKGPSAQEVARQACYEVITQAMLDLHADTFIQAAGQDPDAYSEEEKNEVLSWMNAYAQRFVELRD